MHNAGDLRPLLVAATRDPDLEILATARAGRLLTVNADDGNVGFSHPLVAATLVESSTSSERVDAHRRLADLLGDDDPDRSTWHRAEATLTPDEAVAGQLEALARRALQRGDPALAVSALLRAADVSPDGNAAVRRVADAAFIGANMTGDLRAASGLLSRAHRQPPDASASLSLAVSAGYALLSGQGDLTTAHRLLTRALAQLDDTPHGQDHATTEQGPAPAQDLLAEALHTLFYVCLCSARADVWEGFYDVLQRLPSARTPVLDLQINTLADPVRTAAAAVDDLDHHLSRLPSERNPRTVERIARAGLHLERIADCRDQLWHLVHEARQGRTVATALGAMSLLATDDFKAGRWDAANALAQEALAACAEYGYILVSWPLRTVQALIAAARGDVDTTDDIADQMTRWAAPREMDTVLCHARHAAGVMALTSGDFEEAYQQFARISPAGEFRPHVAHALWVPLLLVESAAAAGRPAEATAHAEAMIRLNLPALSPRLAFLTAAATAIASPGEAEPPFEQALSVPGADRWPFELARVQLIYGERLRRARRTVAAREQLTRARDLFDRLGAAPWIRRAEHELLATSPTKIRTGTPTTLTPQERTVATLAASGLTNKQIADRLMLSPRTVSAHLHSVFLKLAITTRASLRDALDADLAKSRPERHRCVRHGERCGRADRATATATAEARARSVIRPA